MPTPSVRSLGRIKVGRRTYYLLPLAGLSYGAISLAIVGLALLLVDRVLLGSLERGGWTAGQLWQRHNKLVEDNHRQAATTKSECELRHWLGEPLPKVVGTLRVPSAAESRASEDDGTRSVPATILVLGDSFVWGPPYETLNHLWWRQLAIELERRGYRQVQVVAAGHPGWSTRRELECLRELLPQVKPDLVIWGYVTNDPDEKLVPQISDFRDRGPFPFRVKQQLRALWPNLMFKLESLRADNLAAHYAGPKSGYTYDEWTLRLLEGENVQRYEETVVAAAACLRVSQSPGFLQTLPSWPSLAYHRPRYSPVLPLWEQAGVAVNNTLDEFVRRYGEARVQGPEAIAWGINPADSHPGPRATHFHAVMAADYLERHHPEILGNREPPRKPELAINDWMPAELNVRAAGGDEFMLDYPASTEQMPVLPLSEPAALVALRYPLPLAAIRLSAAGLRGGRMWISTLHPTEQFDECQWRDIGRQIGTDCEFRLPADLAGRAVTAIRIQAEFAGTNRELRLALVRSGEQP